MSNLGKPSGAIGLLKFIAWLSLIGGLVAGVIVFVNFGSVDAYPDNPYLKGRTEPNVLGIAIGVGLILQGALVWAVLLAFADIATDVHTIRLNTTVSKSQRETETHLASEPLVTKPGEINCPFCHTKLSGFGRCPSCGNTIDQLVIDAARGKA